MAPFTKCKTPVRVIPDYIIALPEFQQRIFMERLSKQQNQFQKVDNAQLEQGIPRVHAIFPDLSRNEIVMALKMQNYCVNEVVLKCVNPNYILDIRKRLGSSVDNSSTTPVAKNNQSLAANKRKTSQPHKLAVKKR